jgi:hypothetical protein
MLAHLIKLEEHGHNLITFIHRQLTSTELEIIHMVTLAQLHGNSVIVQTTVLAELIDITIHFQEQQILLVVIQILVVEIILVQAQLQIHGDQKEGTLQDNKEHNLKE